MGLTIEVLAETEAQANSIWADMTSGDAKRHNKALRALFAAPENVQALVKERSGAAATEYYATPEGEDELADWRALDGEPFQEVVETNGVANGSNDKHNGAHGNGSAH